MTRLPAELFEIILKFCNLDALIRLDNAKILFRSKRIDTIFRDLLLVEFSRIDQRFRSKDVEKTRVLLVVRMVLRMYKGNAHWIQTYSFTTHARSWFSFLQNVSLWIQDANPRDSTTSLIKQLYTAYPFLSPNSHLLAS